MRDAGGPAFPHGADIVTDGSDGMTLRDYFAGQVLIMTAKNTDIDVETLSEMSYRLADAMIKERNKGE